MKFIEEKKIKISAENLEEHERESVIKSYLEKNIKVIVDSLKGYQKEFVKKRKKLIAQQRFKCERYNVFTDVINKIALSSNDNKIMQSIDLIEKYVYGTSKDLIFKREKLNVIFQ